MRSNRPWDRCGSYGRTRSYGPTAQAFSGISEMSGLPEPYPPAGIGYSYLDWFGAYQLATAMMAGLYRQRMTGEGCWIDSSQVETGIYLTGPTILDYTANGRRWSRYGNRSPHKPAAPCGAYRCAGTDRWIAITAFTEEQWLALDPGPRPCRSGPIDPGLATLPLRLQNQDYLDDLVTAATERHDPMALMTALQEAGVPAGVCETSRGPLRVGSPAPPPGVGRRARADRDRALAGKGAADQVQRDSAVHRRCDRPARAELWRGQRLRTGRAPRARQGGDRRARQRGRALNRTARVSCQPLEGDRCPTLKK